MFRVKSLFNRVSLLAGDCPWSSYRSYIDIASTPQWLQTKFAQNSV